MSFDVNAVRSQFPILARRVPTIDGERPLTYLDHGASTHAPRPVLDAVMDLMEGHYANIHRGLHTLSQESSDLFDASYEAFADFLGADLGHGCIVLTHNTTGALDLAAHVMKDVPGATLTTRAEHHSNDLPHRRAGDVAYVDVDAEGRIPLEGFQKALDAGNVKLVAVTGASNVTGQLPPLHKIARLAHDADAKILVDAAQLYAHARIDVKAPDHPEHLDFVAAAGHKSYAPFGSAFLYAPREVLDAAPPHTPGGGTVDWVTDMGALHNRSPDRHMGGTPNVAGAVAFAAATRWLQGIGMDAVREHEEELITIGLRRFAEMEERHGVVLLGPRRLKEKGGVFSFVIPDVRHEMVSAILDWEHGIATRNGCFCAHPLLHRLLKIRVVSSYTKRIARGESIDLPGATRGAVGIYNTVEEMERFCDAVEAIAAGRVRGRYETPEPAVCRPIKSVAVEA